MRQVSAAALVNEAMASGCAGLTTAGPAAAGETSHKVGLPCIFMRCGAALCESMPCASRGLLLGLACVRVSTFRYGIHTCR